MRQFILAAVVSTACVGPTPAVVFDFVGSHHAFRHCTIQTGWWTQDLIDACGMPAAFVVDANNAEIVCAAYATRSHSFKGVQGAPFLVACLEPYTMNANEVPQLKQPISVPGAKTTSLERYKVRSVFGLASLPEFTTPS